jgi:thioredoxin-like negative regulator of GroEL
VTEIAANLDQSLELTVNSGSLVIALFSAKWCLAEKVIHKSLLENMPPVVKYAKIDVDADHHAADYYRIVSLPTVIVFNAGREITRLLGSFSASQVLDETKKLITQNSKALS